MADPMSLIAGAERFIRGQVSIGLASREEAANLQFDNLMQMIRTAPQISQAQCADVFDHMGHDNNTFSADQRKEIASITSTRHQTLHAAETNIASNSQNQVNLYTHQYYPNWLWTIILSSDSMGNK